MESLRHLFCGVGIAAAVLAQGCAGVDGRHVLNISVREQKLVLTDRGNAVATYPVSTSKFGVGGAVGGMATPIGVHRIAKKVGAGLPLGAVLKSRRFTGEVVPPGSAGRDPIVTRILWLNGMEPWNRTSFGRHIYIHGTADERSIGRPASYGCIRMRSADVIELYELVGVGAKVHISSGALGGT